MSHTENHCIPKQFSLIFPKNACLIKKVVLRRLSNRSKMVKTFKTKKDFLRYFKAGRLFPKLEPRIDVVMAIMFLQSSIRHKLSWQHIFHAKFLAIIIIMPIK